MLLFLYGQDSFRSKEKLRELKTSFLKNNLSSGLFIFDFSEKNLSSSTFLEAFQSAGLFSAKKFIVALDFLSCVPLENQKLILAELKKKSDLAKDSDLTILFYENGQPKKTTSFYKYLFANAKKQEFIPLGNSDLEKWAEIYIKSSGSTVFFPKNSISLLIGYIGNDLFYLKNELDKLINFKHAGEISQSDIELLVKSQTHSTVFQAIESLLGHNKKNALRLFHDQLQKGEDPFYLLSMYVYQVRNLLKISAAFEAGNTSPQLIAKEVGIHPFVVQKSLPQVRNSSLAELKAIYWKLGEIDLAAKTGQDTIPSLLDKFIAGL